MSPKIPSLFALWESVVDLFFNFAGIMKCDVIAQGIVDAHREVGLSVPLVVRLEGTNVEAGREIMRSSGLPIITAEDLDDAAKLAIEKIGKDPTN